MAKIGRNEPCPCGSGKKYKKCCLTERLPTVLESREDDVERYEDYELLSTEEIFSKLRKLGVDTDKKAFLEDVKSFNSAFDLAYHWREEYGIPAPRMDPLFEEDILWKACMILWQRLAPDVTSSERLNELMQIGYELIDSDESDENDFAKGCTLWLQVWEGLKPRFATSGITSIEDADKVFAGVECVLNWCQDLEHALLAVANYDPSFYQKRFEYCSEFCSLLPDSDDLTIMNMKRAMAECYFGWGKIEEGDRAFERLTEEFPDNVWPYIGWGDMYYRYREPAVKADREKARRIYQMGLVIDSDEKQYLLERLEDLDDSVQWEDD